MSFEIRFSKFAVLFSGLKIGGLENNNKSAPVILT
jgi:hypothetical protein